MPTPLDYERFGLSQDRFARQGDQFGETMDFRRTQDERNFGYRQERDASMMDYRDEQAARQERLAMMRMLPRFQRYQQAGQYFGGGAMSGPARAANEYQESLDRQDAHNLAAVPSWQAERDRSDFAAATGSDLRNYAAQQQVNQRMRLQERQMAAERPINEELERQRIADAEVARLKQGFTEADQIGKFYGAKPGDLYNNYDPKTGMATLPGDYVDDGTGGFRQKPGRQVKLDPRQYAALRSYVSPQEAAATEDPRIPAAQRIQQIAAERRIMPQAVESAREELKKRGRFTEQELLETLERHDAAFLQRNLTHPPNPLGDDFYWSRQQKANQVMNAEEQRQETPWYRRMGIRGMTPIAVP